MFHKTLQLGGFSAQKMEAASSSDTSISIWKSTQRYHPERRENLKSHEDFQQTVYFMFIEIHRKALKIVVNLKSAENPKERCHLEDLSVDVITKEVGFKCLKTGANDICVERSLA